MASPRIAVAAALAVAALGLIGAGAGAQFTDAATVEQRVVAGTLDMRLSGTGTVARSGKVLTLPDQGPTQSSFSTGPQRVILTNNGTIAAHGITVSAAANPVAGAASAALAGQVCLRLVAATGTVYDGRLTSMAPRSAAVTIPAGGSASVTVEFYAGSGACGSLTPAAEGGSINPTLSASIHD
jgi:predicted ribosomally synthesized peptide with SipW-like signal peptide